MKKWMIAFGLVMLCGTAMANFSGGDNFNDNAMDTNKWTNFLAQAGTAMTEANGRLEFSSPSSGPYSDRSHAWEWIANAGSYSEDWSVHYDTVSLIDAGAISENEQWFGMLVRHGSGFDNTFGIERKVENYGGFPLEIIGSDAESNGVKVVDTSATITNDTVTLRVTFDAETKILHSWYNQGYGFVPIANYNASNWGMTDTDTFNLILFGGNRGMVVNSGELYADNFELQQTTSLYPKNPEAAIFCSSIVGSWVFGDPTTKDSVMISFLTNGTYFLAHDGVADGGGQPGMERGTYNWNEVSGLFTHTTTVDTCGDWGLSHTTPTDMVWIVGNTLYLDVPDEEGTNVFKRVYQPTTPPAHIGGWEHVGYPVPTHDNVAFALLPNGIYFFVQDGDSVYDPGGVDGMERGVYTADPNTGELRFTAITDTCGDWGPDDPDPFNYVVNGNTLTLNGGFDLHRVVASECSDLDGDGLPDEWEQLYFSNPTNTTATGHGDNDPLDNRGEYVAGTDPTDGNSFFAITNTIPDPAGFVLNWPAVEGRLYSVNWTDTLTNGLLPLATDIPYPQNSYTDTVHAAEYVGFYQVEVRLDY